MKRLDFSYCVVDIETDECGRPTDFGFYDGKEFLHFLDVDSFVCHMLDVGGVFYAHAGMRFDYCIIYKTLLRVSDSMNIVTSGTLGVYIFMEYTVDGEKRSIALLDSYRLLPAGLDKLAKQFKTTEKIALSVMPWELSFEERLEYLRHDCVALYEVLSRFWEIIDERFSVLTKKKIRAVTLASLSLKVFMKAFLKLPQGQSFMVSSGRLAEFEASSYFGGLVWVNPGVSSNRPHRVNVYDVNSMYPFVMSNSLYPYSYVGVWKDKFDPNSVGLWEIDYFSPGVPFVFDIPSRSISPEGRAIVDTDTVNYIREIGGFVKVRLGYVYQRCDYIFKEFVETLYGLRMEFGNSTAMGFTCKILMNSLYGKFGEKTKKRILTTVEPPSVLGVKIYSSKDSDCTGTEVYDYFEDVSVRHRFVVLSSLVTLRARLHMRRLAQAVGDSVLYIDTDSLHVEVGASVDSLPVGSGLGALKPEFENVDAMYLGKKMYQFYDASGALVKSVNKGVPASAMNVDFRSVQDAVCDFNSFSTLMEVVSDPIHEFRLVKKSRRIRNTVKRD